ncbi:unnamed protein product [Paramecium octaurelia]|uniref:Uncharacterized protein n=1 Tax=Paramecium octaurelia TaxID=43137 RepID=A0A8S1V303_PAROT|nr:unnamed protein product [Paramecium octaurelia]
MIYQNLNIPKHVLMKTSKKKQMMIHLAKFVLSMIIWFFFLRQFNRTEKLGNHVKKATSNQCISKFIEI